MADRTPDLTSLRAGIADAMMKGWMRSLKSGSVMIDNVAHPIGKVDIKPEILDAITDKVTVYIEERERQYQEIFRWLLGESSDFPISEPGKRYNWRPELRERLAELQQQPKDKEG